jgi:hypothetical protein
MSQRRMGLFTCVLVGTALSACSVNLSAEKLVRREDRRFPVSGKPEVSLKTFDGAIRVQSGDTPEVVVTIERQAGDEETLKSLEVKSSQEGNKITVEAVNPTHSGIEIGMHTGRSVALTVSMPREGDLSARSGDGAITVERIDGRIDLNTGDGAVAVRGSHGDLFVRTGDGGVSLEDVGGQVELNTGDGGVRVDGVLKQVKAKTGDGGITVRAAAGSTPTSDWQIESGDGSVSVDVPDGFNAELDARSGDGHVTLRGIEVTNATRKEDGKALTGQIGSGGSRLTIRTGDGSITVGKI